MFWHALHVKSNCEQKVVEALAGGSVSHTNEHGETVQLAASATAIEAWYPWRVSKVPLGNHEREIRRPFFPGYVFARFDYQNLDHRLRILTLPQLVSIVGGEAGIVTAQEIDSLRILAVSKAPVMDCPYLAVGDAVRVTRGPLAGVYGRVLRFHESAPLMVVSIEAMGKSVATTLDGDSVEAIQPHREAAA